MALQPQILSFPVVDDHQRSFLVRASQNGEQALDLDLLATDGESVFRTNILQGRLLPPSKAEFGLNAWISILLYVFQRQAISDEYANSAKGLVVETSVGRKQAEIKISRNIQGIQQQLGLFKLPEENEEALQLFDWTVENASQLQASFQNTVALQHRLNAQEMTIQNLKTQLEDLVYAKKEHEDSILEKFSNLLNSKKLKIRDQQRVLATATISKEQLEQVQAARASAPAGDSQPSRNSKRKAPGSASTSSSDSESFAPPTREILKGRDIGEEMEDENPPSTPEPLEDETTDDEDVTMDVDLAVPTEPASVSKPSQTIFKAAPVSKSLPPKRELPFAQNPGERVQENQAEEDDDGETDDDEL